jgi:hypothetical protein
MNPFTEFAGRIVAHGIGIPPAIADTVDEQLQAERIDLVPGTCDIEANHGAILNMARGTGQ